MLRHYLPAQACASTVLATIALTPISFFPQETSPEWAWLRLTEDDPSEWPDEASGGPIFVFHEDSGTNLMIFFGDIKGIRGN